MEGFAPGPQYFLDTYKSACQLALGCVCVAFNAATSSESKRVEVLTCFRQQIERTGYFRELVNKMDPNLGVPLLLSVACHSYLHLKCNTKPLEFILVSTT